MGLFSRKVQCEFCQREVKKGEYFAYKEGEQEKYCCFLCQSERNIDGYAEYRKRYLDRNTDLIDNDVFRYRKYFNNFTNDKLNKAVKDSDDLYDKLSANLSGVYINNKFIILPFSKVIISTDDVYAIGMDTCTKLSNSKEEVIMLSFFTTNELVPYFAIFVFGKIPALALTTKSKKTREATIQFLTSTCKNLKYEIQKPGKLKKIIKSEGCPYTTIPKDKLVRIIENAELQFQEFSPKAIVEDYKSGLLYNYDLNKEMGFTERDDL